MTTSVHDSSTLREWYGEEIKHIGIPAEKISPAHFFEKYDIDSFGADAYNFHFTDELIPNTAQLLLETLAKTSGAWFVNPLQDWLYLDSKYYAPDVKSERINVPGSVTAFNWTWRMPVMIEKLSENKKLIEKISKVVKIHDSQK